MRHEGWSGAANGSTEPSRLDRRRFLSLGAGCAVPLLLGGALGEATGARPGRQGGGAADPVLDLVSRELLRTYHEMAGGARIRGEYARTLAANIDLLGAHLQAGKDDRRLDDVLRRRLHDRGREATVQDLTARCRDLAVALSLEHGVILRVDRDDRRSLTTLDAIVARGVTGSLRGCRSGLRQFGAAMDQVMPAQNAKPVSVVFRQKPGDDFLGYPGLEGDMTWCKFLSAMAASMGLIAAILGCSGLGAAAGALGVGAAVMQVLEGAVCQQMDVP